MKRIKRLMAAPPDPDRPPPLRVLVVTSELVPFSRTGGLADVVGALSSALADRGAEVDILTPRYRAVDVNAHSLARRLTPATFRLDGADRSVILYEGKAPGPVRVFFADYGPAFDRDGLYGPSGGGEFEDNPFRFGILCRTALGLGAALARRYDVIHGHDWQTALAAYGLARGDSGAGAATGPRPKSVLTIHNLAYQGVYPAEWAARVGVDVADLAARGPASTDRAGRFSLLAAGIATADRVTTVSPRYADEIRTDPYGAGLGALLRARGSDLVGLLNGADYSAWDPMTDGYVAARYSSEDIAPKRRCKAEAQRVLRLPVRAEIPFLGWVGPLTEEKGADLLLAALPALVERGCQVGLTGAGATELESAFQEAAKRWPNSVAVKIGADDPLAHRIIAASDLYLMPSRWEPWGLNQLYALRYGAVPVVRAVGGLADTVEEVDAAADTGTGFRFDRADATELVAAVDRGLALFREPPKWRGLQKRSMTRDFSWAASATRYHQLFAELCGRADLIEPTDVDQSSPASPA